MILVAGATGHLGMEICRRLRSRGDGVRALVRSTSDPEKVSTLESFGARVVRGNLRDRASLDAACAGVRTVISTVSAIVTAQPGDSFDATDGAGTISLVDAARRAEVEHFIFMSFDTDALPDAPLVQAKRAVERHLAESGMAYTILHPSLFMESWLGPRLAIDPVAGTARVYGDGNRKLRYVALADVAELAVQCVSNPRTRNKVIAFGGPDAVSQREAIALFERAVGKPFTIAELPEETLEGEWRSAPDPFSKTFSSFMLGVARGFDGDTTPADVHFPIRLTSVNEYVDRVVSRES
jgi:NADH dehydrogenase